MQRLEAITRQSLDPTTKILAGPFPLSHYPDWGVPAEACSAIVALDGGDLVVVAAAEDALGDAFRAALETWPLSGVPRSPEGWLLTTARRKLLEFFDVWGGKDPATRDARRRLSSLLFS